METLARLTPVSGSRRQTVFTALGAVMLSALTGLAMAKLGTVQRDLKAILLVVAAIVVITAALKPEVGLMLLLALMPFEFSFSGTGTDEVAIVTMALVLVWRIRARAIPAWTLMGGGALVLGSFLAAIGAQDRTSAFWGGVRWLAAMAILFAALSLLRSRQDASRRMVAIFTGSAVIVVFFAFVQSAGINVLVRTSFNAGHASSFFAYYTNYAGYIAIAIVLATGEILSALTERRTARALIFGSSLAFLLIGEALAGSRGGLLAVGAGWLVLLVLNARRGSILFQALVILAVFGGAAYIATPRTTIVKIEERFSAPLGSLEEDKERFVLQGAGEAALRQNPFGLGFANFSYYLRAHVRNVEIHQDFSHAQNTPIQIGLDAGWLGGVGFLMLVFWPIGLVLTCGGMGPSAIRASAFAAALGAFMAQGLYDYLFYEIAFLVFVLALVWGTIHALTVNRQAPPAQHR